MSQPSCYLAHDKPLREIIDTVRIISIRLVVATGNWFALVAASARSSEAQVGVCRTGSSVAEHVRQVADHAECISSADSAFPSKLSPLVV